MVRSNREDLSAIARSNLKLQRGESKWRTLKNTGYVLWRDTRNVHVLSTAFKPNESVTVQRTQKDGSRCDVLFPMPIKQYTQRMGGVDRFDQKRTCFSVSRRSFKWWPRILYFMIDSAIVNAYIRYNSVHPDDRVNKFEFRSTLLRQLIGQFSSRSRRSSLEGGCYVRRRAHRNSSVSISKKPGVPDDIRLQSVGKH